MLIKPLRERSIGFLLCLVIILASGYFAVTGIVGPGEFAYAALASVLSAYGALVIFRLADMEERVRIGWLLKLSRSAANVVLEVWPMTRSLFSALLRGDKLRSRDEAWPFDPGGSEDPDDRGRRALVTLGISLAPARLVVNEDVDDGRLDIASIAVAPKDPDRIDRRWPL